MTSKNNAGTTGESVVAESTQRFADETLAEIQGMTGALQALADAGVAVESIDDFGTGFLVTEKNRLVGVPMVAVEWRFNQGDKGEFVSVTAVTDDGRKIIFNDGGTGVRDQLRMVESRRVKSGNKRPNVGLAFPRGLKASNYTTENGDATTYYIA